MKAIPNSQRYGADYELAVKVSERLNIETEGKPFDVESVRTLIAELIPEHSVNTVLTGLEACGFIKVHSYVTTKRELNHDSHG